MELSFAIPSILALFISVVALHFALKRTKYNEQSLKIQKKMLKESRKYWRSWAVRAKDVTKRVLEQMKDDELERELLKRRIEKEKAG